MTFSWANAASVLRELVAEDAARPHEEQHLDDGQRASLTWMAERLPQSGLVLADEVGTGKTRIACGVVHAVLQAGGRAAVVVPHGLMHQWQHEARIMGMETAKEFTSIRDLIEDGKKMEWEKITPAPDESEWHLVSHGFRAPQVRQSQYPAEWRVALPSYVRAELSTPAARTDRRTHVGQLLDVPHEPTHRIAREIVARMSCGDRGKLRRSLDQLPPFRRYGDNSELIDAMKNGGRLVLEKLLGLWLGEFDLIVIDEAHKSRGEMTAEDAAKEAVPGKVLVRLVDGLLKQPEHGRRLCLTATPMELDLSQWLDLLTRTRSGLDHESGLRVVQRLHYAAKLATEAPDEMTRLDELCEAAKDFTKTLAPYVTRRRRDQDPLIKSFREAAEGPEDRPHPHRCVKRVDIGWTEMGGQNSPWLDVLFAAECMSQSVRGLSLKDTAEWPRAVRDAYTKLSAGHVSIDLSATSAPLRIPDPGVVNDHTRGKIARTAYWYRRLRDGRTRVLNELPRVNDAELDPDAEHPRVLAAVKEIEGWTMKGEKVLVFGVFLRPLRLLRDVLNVRHALRAADAGRPIAHAVHKDMGLRGIAFRQLDRLRSESMLTGRLMADSGTEMCRALADSHKVYEHLRDKVRRRAKKAVIAWRNDPLLLDGAPVDDELERALEDHLVSFVLDDYLAATPESDEVADDHFDRLTAKFRDEQLRPLLGELSGEDVDTEQAVLRQESLRALLDDDDGRQSLHARLLQGTTRWETRRYLQAAFNRPGASPWILIAQSQVGREGLNLHESCRVVVQFHAEWNPAVLEQQIGRVDRKGSLWEKLAREWIDNGAQGEPPFVEVRQLVFEGTYDAFQWDRVMRRQHVFDASLFGSLLPVEAWQRVPTAQARDALARAAPRFQPGQ